MSPPANPPRVRRLLIFVSAVVFVDTVFFAAITPLLPSYVEDLDLTKTSAGVLTAAYPAGTFLAALPCALLAARVGVRPTMLLGLILLAVASVAFAFAESVVALDLSRLVQGAGGACSWAAGLAWLAGAVPSDRRGGLLGTAIGSAILGALFGPVLGALAVALDPRAVFTAVGLAALGLAVWSRRMPAPAPEAVSPLRLLAGRSRDARIISGMWLILMVGLVFGGLHVLVPLRLDELGAGAAVVAGTFLAAAGLEACVSPVAGRISDRGERLAPVLVALPLAALLLAAMPVPKEAWMVVVLMVVVAPVIGVTWAPASALLSEGADARGISLVLAFSLMNVAWSIGEAGGAAASGALAEATSDVLPHSILAAVVLVSAVALIRVRQSIAAIPARAG